MVKRVGKIVLSIGLILIVFSQSVLAVTGKVTGNNVRIREKASSNSQEISVATKNETVEIIGEEGNWYQIKFENITGYISKDYVDTEDTSNIPETTTTEPSNEEVAEPTVPEAETVNQESEPETTAAEPEQQVNENETVTLLQDISLRYIPSFSSRVHYMATNGSTYTIKASLNNWVKLENDTSSGWVLKNVLNGTAANEIPSNDVANETTPSEEPENTNTQEQVSKGKVNVESARIRKSPDGEVLDSISQGTEVTILGEEDGWYKISTDKYDSCYIAKRLIKEL